MNKDLLFYSNKDEYSTKMLELITKNSLKELLPLCIDDSKIKIPSFIKMIPTIYLSKSKQIIIDDEIETHINGLIDSGNKTVDSIEAYGASGMDNFHDIDLSKKEGGNLDAFFTENDKLDEAKILESRAKNVDGLLKLRNSDINKMFEK